MTSFENFTLTASDGVDLAGYLWMPKDPHNIRATFQICHGLAEHAARYDEFARFLTGHGFVVYAHDHRGHGKTAKSEAELGFIAEEHGWRILVNDVKRMHDYIAQKHPGSHHILMGHSMGSFMAQTYLIDHSDTIDACILSATTDDPGALGRVGLVVAQIEAKRLGKRGKSPLLQKMSFEGFNKPYEPARTEFEWLSRDPVEVDKYVADPLCGFAASAQLWVDILTGLFYNAKPINRAKVRKDIPIFLISGGSDPANRLSEGPKALSTAYVLGGVRDISLRIYAGGRHEILNETNRQEVYDDILSWIDRRLPREKKGKKAA